MITATLVAIIGLFSGIFAARRRQKRSGERAKNGVQQPMNHTDRSGGEPSPEPSAKTTEERGMSEERSMSEDRGISVRSFIPPELLAQVSDKAQSVAARTSVLTGNVRGLAEKVAARVAERNDDLPRRFRAWCQESFRQDPAIASWLNSLNDDQFQALAEHAADYCADLGINLAWFVDGVFGRDAELEAGISEVVREYCVACFRAANMQEALRIHGRYQDFLENPHSRQNQAFGEALLNVLIQEELTSLSLNDYLLASTSSRREQVLRAIQTAAEDHPVTFLHVLARVVLDGDGFPEQEGGTAHE